MVENKNTAGPFKDTLEIIRLTPGFINKAPTWKEKVKRGLLMPSLILLLVPIALTLEGIEWISKLDYTGRVNNPSYWQ